MSYTLRLALMGSMVAAVALVAFDRRAASRADEGRLLPEERQELAQPLDWVPFQADVEIAAPGDAAVVTGTFSRAADGSESMTTGRGGRHVVAIKNIARQTAFLYSPRFGWKSHPMELPDAGWHPIRYRPNVNLAKHPERIEGYEVYRTTSPDGDLLLMAPDLNFFALVSQHGRSGQRIQYKNIRIGEPSPDLFLPPPDVRVSPDPRPAGIVRGCPGLTGAAGTTCTERD